MTVEKQIEEMAKIYESARYKASETLGSMNEGEGVWYAKAFYTAGYRKASYVEREIFEEIKTRMTSYVAREIFEEIRTRMKYKLIDGEIQLVIREEDYIHCRKKYTGTSR